MSLNSWQQFKRKVKSCQSLAELDVLRAELRGDSYRELIEKRAKEIQSVEVTDDTREYEHTVTKWHSATLGEIRAELQHNFERGVESVPLEAVLRLVIVLEQELKACAKKVDFQRYEEKQWPKQMPTVEGPPVFLNRKK